MGYPFRPKEAEKPVSCAFLVNAQLAKPAYENLMPISLGCHLFLGSVGSKERPGPLLRVDNRLVRLTAQWPVKVMADSLSGTIRG
jgi:hypothetical protein